LPDDAGLTVDSWRQTNSGLLNALSKQTVSNNLIRSFVIIIVALGISSVLVVSVVQKQREIGILRAMGTGRRRIMTVFLLQGGLGLGLAVVKKIVTIHGGEVVAHSAGPGQGSTLTVRLPLAPSAG